jgi:hypothetical protein
MLLIFGLCWLLALAVVPRARAQHAPNASDAASPPVAAE